MKPGPDHSQAPIAIIGMACIFPQAPDLRAFWNNILDGVDAIGEPVADWGAERYLAAGRIKTQRGGFLKDLYRFDPREFGIMPNSVDGGETDHYLALLVARDALVDAGYAGPGVDHRETGIVLGHSAYLHRGQVTVIQQNIVIDQTLELLKVVSPGLDEQALAELRRLLSRKVPPTHADNAPGLVPNMMTGRIANRLDLRGPNYVLDAACASSLLAVGAAIDELRTGRSRMMLAGGVNATLPADVSTSFTQLGALSGRGKVRPFELGSDGTLLGEGLGVVVLKRIDDALADGDHVYAVIRGVGQSSDGKGTGLLAPSHDGETLAMRRAYAQTGVDPDSVDLVEAHGTGIPLGDQTEIASLKSVFGERRTPVGVKAIGSVKSMISHCIPAAGIASLIKMSLALHHRVLPPTLCEQVNPALGIERTPFFVNTAVAPWLATPASPRRAAVNSFGFGGINAHAILEQAPAAAREPGRLSDWPAELCLISADDVPALVLRIDGLLAAMSAHPQWRLDEVAFALSRRPVDASHRLAIVARDMAGLVKALTQARKKLAEGGGGPWSTRGGTAYSARRLEGGLAFLFPGEGSQYPAMFGDLAPYFEPVRRWLDFWRGLHGLPKGSSRTDIVFPSCEVGAERRLECEKRLHDMDVGSEAVFIGGMAMHELLLSLGLQADAMMGHSSGESAALGACGANPARTHDELAACISRHYAAYDQLLQSGRIATGALLAVGALPPDVVEAEIAATGGEVVLAMDNCSNQIVLYGAPTAIGRIQQTLSAKGGICMPLPFDRGYHTPAFSEVSAAFLEYYRDIRLSVPKVPLYSCASVGLFPSSAAAVRRLAAAQWSQRVRFRETVSKMHDDGVRAFVEVGPSANLTAFVNDILIDREFTAVATNVRRRNGVEQLLSALGQLHVLGRSADWAALFSGRRLRPVDLNGEPAARIRPLLDNTMPMIRLSEADKEVIRRLVAPVSPEARPIDTIAAVATNVPDRVEPAFGDDSRGRVMSEYFELMRGFLDQQRALAESLSTQLPDRAAQVDSPAPMLSTHAVEGRTPLLDELILQDGEQLHARSTLSIGNDRFIRDHVMSGPVAPPGSGLHGLPCVPFMVSLELLAEACAALAGRFDVGAIENVKAYDWIALDDGEITVDVHAHWLDRAAGRCTARVSTPRGIAVSGEIVFASPPRLTALPALADRRPWGIDVPHLYTHGRYGMFHGPVFHSMGEMRGWDDTGIDVGLTRVSLRHFFADGLVPELVLNPVLLDAMGQVVPCWLVQYVGPEFHSFPSTIGRIEFNQPCPSDRDGLELRARQRPADPSQPGIFAPKSWDFECVDADGQVLMRAKDLVNLFFMVTPGYHAARTHPLEGAMGDRLAFDGPPQLLLWRLPMLPEDLCTQSGGICLRIISQVLLDDWEREQWRALTGSLRQRREWLFGRAAIKEGVRRWFLEHAGEKLFSTDIRVLHDAQGAPYVDGWWSDRLPAPQVSVSHAGEHCVAAVSAPQRCVGVDVEPLSDRRSPELIASSFSEGDQAWLDGLQGERLLDRVLRLWCAKEAAAKCLGTGLQGQPEAFPVVQGDPECEMLLIGTVVGELAVTVRQHQGTIIAVALQTADGEEETG